MRVAGASVGSTSGSELATGAKAGFKPTQIKTGQVQTAVQCLKFGAEQGRELSSRHHTRRACCWAAIIAKRITHDFTAPACHASACGALDPPGALCVDSVLWCHQLSGLLHIHGM